MAHVFHPMFIEKFSFWNKSAVKISADRRHESADQLNQSISLIPHRNEFALYMILVEPSARFRSRTNISIRRGYSNELIRE